MKIVLDTNVIISGVLNPQGLPSQIINLLLNGKITVLYDNRILNEYSEVLRRKKFNFRPSWIEPFLEYIRAEGIFITAEPIKERFEDEDDKMFYEVAITGKAKYVVTGNKEHFPHEELIKSPKEFIDIYLSEKSGEGRDTI